MKDIVVASVQIGEVVEARAFTAEDVASSCGVSVQWVHARVAAGVLYNDAQDAECRFDAIALVRARRILQLEKMFDADPQLAALTADLIEEVNRLRRQLLAQGIEPL